MTRAEPLADLAAAADPAPRRRIRRAAAVVGLVACAAALLWFWLARPGAGDAAQADAAQRLMLQAVDRGLVERSIQVSGTLNPVNQVDVGTQVSGTVRRLHADFNASVRRGQLLAELDTTALDADLAAAAAAVRSAQASLGLARSELGRDEGLLAQGFIAPAAVAQTATSAAAALATLQQQQAALRRAQNNRQHAEIRSPVSGTVVSREVSVGQTVQASFATPVLFRIAEDLAAMQIDARVSEADVGLVRTGQPVRFTVDAFPDEIFDGVVHQIRNNYSVQQNVVTYTVVVQARNDAGLLRPGMTAYLTVGVGRRAQAVRIPNAALRWEPTEALRRTLGVTAAAASAPALSSQRTVWRARADGRIEPVAVRLGLSDAQWTVQAEGALQPGDRLAVGEAVGSAPLAPRMF